MNKILTPKEKNKLVSSLNAPTKKCGGALRGVYPTKMQYGGSKKK
jgi:hypothetical protein